MAKVRISELETKYAVSGKEISAYLGEMGVEVSATGEIDEAGQNLVREHFGSKSKGQGSRPQAAGTPPQGDKPKKKKIIIVTNNNGGKQGNSYVSGQGKTGVRTGQGQSQGGAAGQRGQRPARPAGSAQGQSAGRAQGSKPARPAGAQGRPAQAGAAQAGRTGAQAAYRPIKPKTVPSQMQVDFHKSEPVRPEKAAPAPQTEEVRNPIPVPETAAPVVTEPVKAAPAPAETPAKAEPAAAAPAPVKEQAPAPAPAAKAEAPAKTEQAAEAAPAPAKEAKAPAKTEAPAAKAEPAKTEPVKTEPAKAEKAPADDEPGSLLKSKPTHYDLSAYAKPVRRSSGTGASAGARGGANGARGVRTNDRPSFGQGRGPGQGRPAPGQGGGRSFGPGQGGNRPARPGQAPAGAAGGRRGSGGRTGGFGGGSGEGFAAGSNDARKRQNQSKDRRKNERGFAPEESKERKGRAGRFIRPVVEHKEEPKEQIKVITLPEKLTIRDLAEKMHMQPAEIIKKLFLAGKIMTVNSEVNYEEAENIAADYEILCEKEETVDVIEELLKEDEEKDENLVTRPPVICVMGHVDHGKTSLLDYIRKTSVTSREAGGITQAIGAYTVDVDGRSITFLDTPGHEAFTAMRMRGAKSTDIAVLVVAADDGVMPQTVEAINHAKAAGVEIIVAINKIDKPDANIDRVREQLSKYELIPTEWGGSTEFVPVSAKSGEGVDTLLETILLTADVLELKANPDRMARGLVLEAKLDKGRGPVANVLVQKGTLHVGDFISAGIGNGKVRALINDRGERVKEAGPSTPVMVLGLSDVPSAGEVILAHADDKTAKAYADTYRAQHKEELMEENRMSMNRQDLFEQMREGKMKELDLIVKADVQGSVEALCASLLKLSNDEVLVKIIHSAAGNITESDVSLASASNAAIVGFNVHPEAVAKSMAEQNGVSIHLYKVIYEAIDDVDAALKGMLAPVYEEKVLGHVEVRQLFKSGKIGNIAGSYVLDGLITRDSKVRITRGKDLVFEGPLASLKRFKDDVKEVKAGYECGLVFDGFDSMQVGDMVEAYTMVEVPREQVIAMKEAEKKAAAKAKEANGNK